MEGTLVGESIIVGRELGPVYCTGDRWDGTEPGNVNSNGKNWKSCKNLQLMHEPSYHTGCLSSFPL